jgi:hypothetical protein
MDTRPRGYIDARSMGFGVTDPVASPTQVGVGMEATPFTRMFKTWSRGRSRPAKDAIEIRTTNVRRFVIDTKGANVTRCAAVLLQTDGPVDVILAEASKVRTIYSRRAGTFAVPWGCDTRNRVG